MLREKVMMIFPRSPIWYGIMEPAKTLTSLDHISENIVNQDLKFIYEVHQYFNSTWLKFQILRLCKKKMLERKFQDDLFEEAKP